MVSITFFETFHPVQAISWSEMYMIWYTHNLKHAWPDTYMRWQVLGLTRTCADTYLRWHVHALTCTCADTYMRWHIHDLTCTWIHDLIRTWPYTYMTWQSTGKIHQVIKSQLQSGILTRKPVNTNKKNLFLNDRVQFNSISLVLENIFISFVRV